MAVFKSLDEELITNVIINNIKQYIVLVYNQS